MKPPFHVRETRYPELGFTKIEDGSRVIWRVVCRETGAEVGPLYASRSELLADLERYARESWGLS